MASRGDADGINLIWHGSLLFFLGAAWGLQFTLLKIATNTQLNEFNILFVSMFMIAAVCVVALYFQRSFFIPTRKHMTFFTLSGLFGFVLPLGGIIFAAHYFSAGLIVLFESLTPVFTVAIALLLGTEQVSSRRIFAVALGLTSVIIVGWEHLIQTELSHLVGLLIVLGVPVFYAIDGIYVAARWPSDLKVNQIVTGEALAGTVIILPVYLLLGEPLRLVSQWHEGHWSVLVFILISLVEIVVYFYLLKTVGALYVSMASFIALFSGLGFGIALLGETHSALVWASVCMVCVALYLVIVKDAPALWKKVAIK